MHTEGRKGKKTVKEPGEKGKTGKSYEEMQKNMLNFHINSKLQNKKNDKRYIYKKRAALSGTTSVMKATCRNTPII